MAVLEPCWCEACNKDARTPQNNWMILCPTCGNKRCPSAENHIYLCSGSNDLDQTKVLKEGLIPLARSIAIQSHAGQYRHDDNTPYITHPAEVAAMVQHDEELHAAAWLHDVIENSSITREDLRRYGSPEGVVQLVETLTRGKNEQYSRYIARVRQSPKATTLKVADIVCNLKGTPPPSMIVRYEQSLAVLATLPPDARGSGWDAAEKDTDARG